MEIHSAPVKLAAILLGLTLLLGCTNDPVDDKPERIVPEVGSTYTYRFTQDASDLLFTYEVRETGLNVLGRGNVSKIAFGAHSYAVEFNNNGDFGLLNSEYDSIWKPHPIVSRQPFTSTPDTTYHFTYYVVRQFTITPGADTSRIINGKAMLGHRVEMTTNTWSYDLEGVFLDDWLEYRTYTWISELGMFSDVIVSSPDQSTSRTELVEYTIK